MLVAVFAGYVLSGKAGLALAFVNASATAVWPPTGIAIASLLLVGIWAWPAVFAGAFVVNLTTAGSVWSSLGIAAGNTLEAVVAARLVLAFANGTHAFERPRDVVRFTILAALAATTVSATIGVSTLVLTGNARWSDIGPVWFTWWLGDAAGALVVAPAIVLFATRPALPWAGGTVRELAAMLALLIALAAFVFLGLGPPILDRYPLAFVCLPVLVWAAFRFGPREAAAGVVILSGIAVSGTLGGHGAFAVESENDALLLLQSFDAVASLTALTLAAAVVERRRAEERLLKSEELLRIAEERKVAEREEFLSLAAHELRTPMTSLHLAVQHMLRLLEGSREVDADIVTSIDIVRQESTKLARLVTALLVSVRAQSGRLELEVADADLRELVASAVERAGVRAAGHRFRLSLPSAPVHARVDALRLDQVLDNVLDNAAKFSPAGETIEVDLRLHGPDRVRVDVRDHGVGIPPERRARIFERFYQAHTETMRSGLGLGLYVAQAIVEGHGGTIAAEFPTNGGTRIVIELPVGAPRPATPVGA